MGKIALSGFLLLLCVVCGFLAQLGSDDAPQVPLWGGGETQIWVTSTAKHVFQRKDFIIMDGAQSTVGFARCPQCVPLKWEQNQAVFSFFKKKFFCFITFVTLYSRVAYKSVQ